MKLFFDEDAGTGVAKTIPLLGMLPQGDVTFVRRVWRRTQYPAPIQDETWIPWAASHGFMAISRNTAIIGTDRQRQLVADSGLGIVFIPQHITALEVFNLIQRRWSYLELMFAAEPRPFMYHIPLTGDPWRDPAIPLDYPTRTRESLIQALGANIRAITPAGPEVPVPATAAPKELSEEWKAFEGFLESVPLAQSGEARQAH